MTLAGLVPDKFFNAALAKQPMNWAVIWIFASLWLLLFHVVVQGWLGMLNGKRATISAAPGQVAVQADATNVFSQSGTASIDLATFLPTGSLSQWADDGVSRYPEDGYAGAL